MRMSLIWGFALILLGISMVIKAVFHISLPLFRIAFALFIIWWGVKLLLGNFNSSSDSNTTFFQSEHIMPGNEESDYNIVFGSGIIDLRGVDLSNGSKTVKVSAVFGTAKILVNPEVPTVTKVSVAFGEAKTPEGFVSFLGDRKFSNSAYVKGENVLIIKTDAVFGAVNIEES